MKIKKYYKNDIFQENSFVHYFSVTFYLSIRNLIERNVFSQTMSSVPKKI